MHNSPELNGKYLGTISSDFIKVSDTLKEAGYLIRNRGISEYPIFPVSSGPLPIGALLKGASETDLAEETTKNYYISFLDEFVQRGIVSGEEGLEAFKAAWRDPDEYCCLFVAEPEFTNFVFIPYPED